MLTFYLTYQLLHCLQCLLSWIFWVAALLSTLQTETSKLNLQKILQIWIWNTSTWVKKKSAHNPKCGMATDFIQHWIRDQIYIEVVLPVEKSPYGKWNYKLSISHKSLLYADQGTMVVPMWKLFFLDLCFLKTTIVLLKRQLWLDSSKTKFIFSYFWQVRHWWRLYFFCSEEQSAS